MTESQKELVDTFLVTLELLDYDHHVDNFENSIWITIVSKVTLKDIAKVTLYFNNLGSWKHQVSIYGQNNGLFQSYKLEELFIKTLERIS